MVAVGAVLFTDRVPTVSISRTTAAQATCEPVEPWTTGIPREPGPLPDLTLR